MKFLRELRVALPFIGGLLLLKANNWQNEISYWLRFVLCGIFSYIAYMIFSQLGPLMVGKEELLISLGFENPGYFFMVLLILVFGYFGLFCSVLAGALYTSLLPKT